jgi:aldose 1-epimerase
VSQAARVSSAAWGKTSGGTAVTLYTLQSESLTVRLTNYGARIVGMQAPDRNGQRAEVVLGCADVAGLEADTAYMGPTVGRYANRIAEGRFTLDGVEHRLPINNPPNAIHGGPVGFDRHVWRGTIVGENAVAFSLTSPDGDQGYPGEMEVTVLYTLEGDGLRIDYKATTTKPTIVNLTNHAYFNLAGEASGDMLAQVLRIEADWTASANAVSIPTGKLEPVEGTPLDFRKPTAIGARIHEDYPQLKRSHGYDQSYEMRGEMGTMREAAEVHDPSSGRTLTVLTTEPAVHFYAGGFIDGTTIGHSGRPYQQYAGFALETQHYPDSPNHDNFPSTVLRPGEVFTSSTIYRLHVR